VSTTLYLANTFCTMHIITHTNSYCFCTRDGEEVDMDAMLESSMNQSPFRIDIPWDPDPEKVNYNKIYFDYFFPSLDGKAEVMDKFFDDPRAPMYSTVNNDNIKFHRPHDDDPDHLVSDKTECILYIVNECILYM